MKTFYVLTLSVKKNKKLLGDTLLYCPSSFYTVFLHRRICVLLNVQLIIGLVHFVLSNIKVRHSDCWATMVQHLADCLNWCSGLPQCAAPTLTGAMAADILLRDHFPGFAECTACRLSGDGPGWLILHPVRLRLEQENIFRVCSTTTADNLPRPVVDWEHLQLACFLLLYSNHVPGDIIEGKRQQIANAKSQIEIQRPGVSKGNIATA